MKYKYLLFDLDGTLTDPKVGITTCVQHALHHMGIEEPDIDKLEPFIGPPLIDSFMNFYGMETEQAKQAVQYYRERFSTVGLFENEVYKGIPELLQALKKEGCRIAIASSKPTVFVERILEHFHIASYFDVVVGSELDGTRSKKEEVVGEALNRMLPEEYLQTDDLAKAARGKHVAMIGDRMYDIQGAKAFHLASIGVEYGYAAEGELQKEGADYVVSNVEELRELLTECC